MVLERYRSSAGSWFTPAARALGRAGLTPNAISVTSLVFAFGAGAAFYFSAPGALVWLIVASALVSLNGIFDALDGILARLTDASSKRGDYLDHVIDRYADVAILTGVALSPFADVRLGLLAIVGTFLTSYMGTQAQALGLGRNYGGVLGRADRLVLLIGAPLVEFGVATAGVTVPVFGSVLNLLLAYFAVVGNLTAVQRFNRGWQELKDESS